MKKITLFIFALFCLFSNHLLGQCGTTPSPPLSFINPSFEGPSCAGCQPGPWVNCGGTPDTQPGSWGFTQPASHGNSYVSFLQDGANAAGYYEGSSQALSSCMTAGQVYSFSVDLAHSNVYNTAGPGDCYSSLEILGSNGICAESEVLWQSGPITSTTWQTYTVTLTPTSNWCFVSFRPYWISPCNGYVNISLDNLGPLETNSPTVDATVSADISCSQNILGTIACPADSIVLSGAFNGSPMHAVILTDSTWQANVVYSLGATTSQTISIEAFLTIGGSLHDTIIFNLVDIVPDFSATSVCTGNVTTFTDNSTASSGSIISWAWNFDDGSPVNTNQNPTHTYANPGTYNVLLMINSSDGCTDTITKSVEVYFKPTVGFTYNNICFGDTLNFTNTSSVDNSTSIASYLWVFGDSGPTGSLQSPGHYYSGSGTFSVTLVTTTVDGCSNAFNAPVNVFDRPASAFTFSNTCLSDSAIFTNSSLSPTMGNIAGWAWDFGDGSALNTTAWSPGHLYPNSGTYLVNLITYSSNLSCPDTLQDSITVFPSAIADFDFINVCLNQAMNFNDLSTVSSGSILSRSWNFGDGSPLVTTQNPSHTYAAPGAYSVTLVVTNSNNCNSTITKITTLHPFPDAQFTAPSVCDGSVVQFNDLSTIPTTDTIQSWVWDFGDGSPHSTTQDPSHLYSGAGFSSVQLLVISNFGCKDSITEISVVNPNPIVNYTADDTIGCEPLCVNFQSVSSILTGSNTQWLWNFGNGSATSGSQNPNNCYSNDSIYVANFFDVTLTVTSDSGCFSSLSKNNYITVYSNPNASFTAQPGITSINNPLISISNLSTGANYWTWNFGDTSMDSSSTFLNPTHVYSDSGTYIITLITSTQYNCVDTAYQTVIIEPDFIFYIPNAFTPNGDGINDSFTGTGIFIFKYEMSIFDRWGNLIFFSDDINTPWDGKANQGGDLAQADVYVYVVKVVDFSKRKHNYSGIVTLVR
ncbi:MAG: PKD domain-containing protein [Bacteroidetes bacterium]|nr:PKD domain-containing protein [Bacteroidota bacterium]